MLFSIFLRIRQLAGKQVSDGVSLMNVPILKRVIITIERFCNKYYFAIENIPYFFWQPA